MLPFWLTYITRSFARSGRRVLFAVLCVAVGTAGVVALQTAGLTVENALTSNIRASNGGDISVASDQVPLSRSDLQVFQRLQRQGRVTSWTAVASVHATALGPGERLVPLSVDLVSVPPYPLGGQPTFTSPSNGNVGALLSSPGDVLVTTVLAEELGVGVGSRVTVNGIGGPGLRATVRGILSETSFEHSAAMTASIRDMPALTSAAPRYTAVYLNVSGSPNPVARFLRGRFPTSTVQTVSEALTAAHQEVHDFQQFLLIVGLLALLIAGVGILNAMQSILARRRLEIAMLKAMGFREWTLYLLFGGEALLVGLIGGVVGTVLGLAGSKIITDALAHSQGIQVTFVVDARTILTGVLLGVGATLVFAVMPIVRAAAFRPLEVLREGIPPAPSQWARVGLLVVLVFLLFTGLAGAALGDPVLAAQFVGGTAAACAVLAALFALGVAWMARLGPPSSRLVGALVFGLLVLVTAGAALRAPALSAILALGAILFGLTLILSRRQMLPLLIGVRSLSRRRARTSLMLVAFGAGILAMTVSLTIALGLQSQISSALATNRASNLVVISPGDSGRRVLAASRPLGGIYSHTVMTTAQTLPVRVKGRPLTSIIGAAPAASDQEERDRRIRALSGLTGWDLAHGSFPTSVRIVAGRGLTSRDAGTANILLTESLMHSPFFLAVGDGVTLRETGSGVVKTVRVIGFYERPRRARSFGGFFTPPIYGDRTLALALGGADVQTVVTYSADQKLLARDATLLQRALPGALVIDIGDLTAIVDTILDELLHVLAVVTALVLGAGVAVVANGVALAMLERRREIALFKAIGFGPGSVGSFVLVENALVGTLAGAVSVLLTAIALAVISRLALQQAIGFDPVLAVVILLIATAIAVVTAYLSARAPIAVRPLEALRND